MVSPWCTEQSVEAMAEAGWRQEQIEQLEAEVQLAVRKAEASSFSNGDTRARQLQLMERAEKEARQVAHDRWHNELGDAMKELNSLNKFAEENPGEHYGSEVALKALAAGGGEPHKHLTPGRPGKKKGA